jgi:hypothetical protein
MGFQSKLLESNAWKRIFFEKITEPIHVNLMALAVWVFGNYRAKITFDLVLREYHAFSLLKAADQARNHGIEEITAIEFGVAAGGGLMNIARISKHVTRLTGVRIKVVGFDTGAGMPDPVDFRDHPDLYQKGDFPMDVSRLRAALPADVELVIGELKDTLPKWLESNEGKRPIGYISIDVDYYSSTMEALRVFEGEAASYLPWVVMYFDDIMFDEHNDACGELLAIKEFNARNEKRIIQHPEFITSKRVYKNAPWLKHIYYCHILDHPSRSAVVSTVAPRKIANPYLS